eukprot:Colp12_sorted_trinity150504_noHs@8936
MRTALVTGIRAYCKATSSKMSGIEFLKQCQGCIFDMDGTLTIPVLDFALMRKNAGIPQSMDILVALDQMPAEQKAHAKKVIEDMELEAARNVQLQPGLLDLLEVLDEHCKLPRAIVTRNGNHAVELFLEHLLKYKVHPGSNGGFSTILTRDFLPFKPSPDSVFHICEKWGVSPKGVVFVGDGKDDLLCGRAAGSHTILLRNDHNGDLAPLADLVVDSLTELAQLFREELAPVPAGECPK